MHEFSTTPIPIAIKRDIDYLLKESLVNSKIKYYFKDIDSSNPTSIGITLHESPNSKTYFINISEFCGLEIPDKKNLISDILNDFERTFTLEFISVPSF